MEAHDYASPIRVVPRRPVVGDNLSGSHHQSQVNCVNRQSTVFMLALGCAVMLLAV